MEWIKENWPKIVPFVVLLVVFVGADFLNDEERCKGSVDIGDLFEQSWENNQSVKMVEISKEVHVTSDGCFYWRKVSRSDEPSWQRQVLYETTKPEKVGESLCLGESDSCGPMTRIQFNSLKDSIWNK